MRGSRHTYIHRIYLILVGYCGGVLAVVLDVACCVHVVVIVIGRAAPLRLKAAATIRWFVHTYETVTLLTNENCLISHVEWGWGLGVELGDQLGLGLGCWVVGLLG